MLRLRAAYFSPHWASALRRRKHLARGWLAC